MRRARGFTLIEVLVALVIVAFGAGALMAALSSSADNISALREKTLAQWIALNQIADARLNLNAPQPGVTEGDVKAFANADWHWRRDVVAVDMIPGLLEIAVRVKRLQPGDKTYTSSSPNLKAPARSASGLSSGAPSSFFNTSSSGGYSSGAFGSSSLGQLSSSSGMAMKGIGLAALPGSDTEQHWVVTVVGFRSGTLAPASGEQPDWGCNGALCTGGGASGSSSGTNLANPNPGAPTASSGGASSTSLTGTSSGP